MKLIHLSDLHIGKKVNGFSMLEDQKHILQQVLEIIDREQPQGVILAGDIYDKPVPPAEAVRVFDRFLTELAGRKQQIFMISGNHDSAERLAFGASLVSETGVYISPVYDGEVRGISCQDAYGPINIYLLPFLKPSMVRQYLQDEDIKTYQDAVEAAVKQIKPDVSRRNIIVAHQFVTGAVLCDSEEVAVGGLDQVEAGVFRDFDYVALGHIHSPQHVSRPEVRYCGTLLKYSFSEAGQEKTVTVVELKNKGQVEIRNVSLKPLRDLRKVRGTYQEIMKESFDREFSCQDYVQVTLTDEEDVIDALAKLRIRYPNLMRLEYDNRRTRECQNIEAVPNAEEKSELELFEAFFQMQNNQSMQKEQIDYMTGILEQLEDEKERRQEV